MASRRSMSGSSRPTSMPRRSRSPVVASTRRARWRASRRHCAIAISRRPAAAFEVVKSLRSQMVFGEHDLSARVPFPRIDLILCRNVLIYFTQPLQRIALETFAYSLRPDGRLVLGLSETVAALPGPYDEQHARLRIYRRLPGQQPVPQAWPKVVPTAREVGIPLDRAIRSTRRDAGGAADPAAPAEGILLGLDVGVIVVDPHYDIIRINTAARRVLGIHGTAFDQDFVHLADALPSTQIRNAIERPSRARRPRRSTRSNRPTSRRTPPPRPGDGPAVPHGRQRRVRSGDRAGRRDPDRARARRPRPGPAAPREGGGRQRTPAPCQRRADRARSPTCAGPTPRCCARARTRRPAARRSRPSTRSSRRPTRSWRHSTRS